MKYLFLTLLLFSLSSAPACTTTDDATAPLTQVIGSTNETYLAEMSEKWINSCKYTHDLIEAMPEELIDFQPTEDVRTFKEQIIHICENIQWLSTSYLDGLETEGGWEPTSKAELLALFDRVAENSQAALAKLDPSWLDEEAKNFFAGKKTKRQIVNLMQDHHTHHRGQAIVYLRLNDIKPPSYSGW